MDIEKDEAEVITEEEKTDYAADGVEEDTETEEDFEDSEEETEEETDDFEYDEDGNIIFPDDEEEEEAAEDDGEEAEGDGDGEEAEEETDSTPAEADTEPEPTPAEPDKRDAENAELRRQLAELQSMAKEALTRLGVEKEDALLGLAELAGETDGVTGEEFLENKRKADREKMQAVLAERAAFEKMAQEDLAVLHTEYPETKAYKTIWDMPENIRTKFGRNRDLGLSAKDAYAAANPDGIREAVATAARQKSLRGSKSHLSSVVPQGARDTSAVRMTRSELAEWRGYFPGKSDKEIVALYKETHR